ncbi:hypothetical protein H6764_01415 [Candidatus Nomurabacteria bacterium]|nr:hypothetical protein [Candidatus Nomurabacteria bacterium]
MAILFTFDAHITIEHDPVQITEVIDGETVVTERESYTEVISLKGWIEGILEGSGTMTLTDVAMTAEVTDTVGGPAAPPVGGGPAAPPAAFVGYVLVVNHIPLSAQENRVLNPLCAATACQTVSTWAEAMRLLLVDYNPNDEIHCSWLDGERFNTTPNRGGEFNIPIQEVAKVDNYWHGDPSFCSTWIDPTVATLLLP